MPSKAIVIAAGLIWLGGLFAVALWGERRGDRLSRQWPWIYGLSLAVYCTSWTFYGTVTQAAQSGWWLPPTFVGSILLYVFAIGVLEKLVAIAREYNASSIADLVAARLGRSSSVAAIVTAVAVLGIVPYIALQLKAVAMSYSILTQGGAPPGPAWQDSALWVALVMALFAILFGTRRVSAAEHNRGLVLAMAFEAVLKLVAMLALLWVIPQVPAASGVAPGTQGDGSLVGLVILGALAMFTLPHQFHVGVVECRQVQHLATARWLFPLYMVLIAVPILPLARAGESLLAARGVPSDLYVLALPMATGHDSLALLAFLGGLSAATGMVILATLSLSLMIGNHWLAPLWVRGGWAYGRGGDLRGAVLLQRRVGVVAIVLLAWIYSRAVSAGDALADIGAISFSVLGTLAPAVLVAVYRPGIGPRVVAAGIAAGVAVWIYVLLLPSLLDAQGASPAWLTQGPWGASWLAPESLFGLGGWERLNRAVILSLGIEIAVIVLLTPRAGRRAGRERLAVVPVELQRIARRFLSEERVAALFADSAQQPVMTETDVARVEHELAAVIGTASARLLVDTVRREAGPQLDQVASIVTEASADLRFNQRVLEAALQNMSQGMCVVGPDLCLVAWNRRYAEMFGFPPEMLHVGRPIADLLRHSLAQAVLGDADIDAAVQRRLFHLRAGTAYVAERRLSDDTIIQIRRNPMPGGGFVATFTDVTVFRHNEAALRRANETLETRVIERTAELEAATREAQRAHAAKSRSLAAVSHDLAQPLNAAHLFTHALSQQLRHPQYREAVDNIDGALNSAEALLGGLLEVARLDAGGLKPQPGPVRIDDLLQHLAAEFRVLAAEKGLALHGVATRAWVLTDAPLLRRVLQNFLANAVRYTATGRILVGCRRQRGMLWIQVWDSGVGIAPDDQKVIFEEFRRLDRGGSGLGIGLSIAQRIADLLDHPIAVRSWPGRGSCFSVGVPLTTATAPASTEMAAPAVRTPRRRVLVIDNDAAVRKAMQALLSGWHCDVSCAADCAQALAAVVASRPDLVLLDFHLDGEVTGDAVLHRLRAEAGEIPCVFITADRGEAVRTACEDLGCPVLYKPLKPLALKSVMTRLAGSDNAAPA
ncbi:hybrid sensor histidine kinase/response regulator [Tahibacter amnicola]|uniref:histidine kinase n=1 Tax=Tahibacter amnicola TaxID=2976241 RepID=A0ABY6BHG2_9GAMM|nr:PAS domain-containing hybrid sensor histidine kinase/response regulator [Tahibacter amnicola]UXI69454.1 PAS domain-containing hybrid sensor histidine kinase/response regulator [Tahibacter amnicola]